MAHSIASVLVHIVFSTKGREPVITPEIEPKLYPYIAAIFRAHGSPSLAGDGTADHTHWLISLSRTITIANLVEEVKKGSSRWLKEQAGFETFQWQIGYGAFSIGASAVDSLKAYIARQKEHHRTVSFQDEYRRLLGLYGLKCDERYAWD